MSKQVECRPLVKGPVEEDFPTHVHWNKSMVHQTHEGRIQSLKLSHRTWISGKRSHVVIACLQTTTKSKTTLSPTSLDCTQSAFKVHSSKAIMVPKICLDDPCNT